MSIPLWYVPSSLSVRFVADFWQLVWPAVVDVFFLNLLSQRDPIALIILSHFAVLMDETRYSWWMRGWPQRILRAAHGVLKDDPVFFKWLEWPSQRIKGPYDRDTAGSISNTLKYWSSA